MTEVKGWAGKVYLIGFLEYRLMRLFSNRRTAGKELKLCIELTQGIDSGSWENAVVKVSNAVLK